MFSRSERLESLLKEEIALALQHMKDIGARGLLTITDVKLSPDRKTAFVYYSFLGSDHDRELMGDSLRAQASLLRSLVKKRVYLKLVPKLVFSYDETPRHASRIDELLHKIEKEHGS